jgi:hypothetical protein
MTKIKKPTSNKGANIQQPEVRYNNIDYPIFCFKHLHKDYSLSKCEDSEKKNFVSQLVLLSSHTWNDIQLAPKHGLGSEKINLSSIKASLPVSFTEEVKHLLAFRFDGKKAFVGFRSGFIFHIFYLDRDFTLYQH